MPDVIRTDPVTLRRLYETARTAEAGFRRAFVQAYPVGGAVSWDRQGVQHGTVGEHGEPDRLYVHNTETGAAYWIRHADVMEVTS